LGDRRNELVVITIDADHATIRDARDRCLLGDREMVAGSDRWRSFPDPLPPWLEPDDSEDDR
jgi:hypothetical protein